jgi:hypothetical protein
LKEFNQCQNQLKLLYTELLRKKLTARGSTTKMAADKEAEGEEDGLANRWEFTAYRLLYYVYMRSVLGIQVFIQFEIKEEIKNLI